MTLHAKRVVAFLTTVAAGIVVLMYFDRSLEDRNVMLFVLGVAAVLSVVESVLHARQKHSNTDVKR